MRHTDDDDVFGFERLDVLHIAFRQRFITGEQIEFLRADAARLCRMLSGLRRSAVERAASLNSKP